MGRLEPRIQSIKGKKKISYGGGSPIFLNFERRERERREKKNQNFSLRFMKFRQLEFIESRVKIYLFDEGYMSIPKT